MKRKQILIIVILLIAGLLLGNWVYGNILAKKIEESINKKVDDAGLSVNIDFGEIKVNPLFSKMNMSGLIVTSEDGGIILQSKGIVMDMPYSEALRMLKSKRFEELKSFRINLNDMKVNISEGTDNHLLINDLMIDFDGYLTRSELENLKTAFPEEKQKLNIAVKNVNFSSTSWLDKLGFTDEQVKKFNQIDNINIKAYFDPDKSEISFNEFKLNSPLITYKSAGTFNYSGNGFNDFKPAKINSEMNFELNEKGIEWGDAETTGKFSLDNIVANTHGTVTYDGDMQNIISQQTELLIEGLKLEYAGDKKAELEAQTAILGINPDKLNVTRLAVSSQIVDNHLTISNTELISSLLNADLTADVSLNPANRSLSEINKATLIVSELAPGLQNGISTLELMTGKSLPRKGKDIILEISGQLTKPKINGWNN